MQEIWKIALTILGSGSIFILIAKYVLDKSVQTVLKLETDKITMLRRNDLEHKKAQVKELYGPLYGLLKTNQKIYDLWMEGKLNSINLKVKQMFKENNDKAKEVIIKNAHLIDENPMPEMFIRYVTSSQVWSMYCSDTEDGVLPSEIADHPDIKWSQEFMDYICRKYETMSRELEELYVKHGITSR